MHKMLWRTERFQICSGQSKGSRFTWGVMLTDPTKPWWRLCSESSARRRVRLFCSPETASKAMQRLERDTPADAQFVTVDNGTTADGRYPCIAWAIA